MSTNWYAKYPGQPADEAGLHIGKGSGGWEFTFRAHPSDLNAGAAVCEGSGQRVAIGAFGRIVKESEG